MRGAAVKSEKLSRSSIQVKREKAARVAASSDDDENDEEPQASGDGPSQSGTQDAEEEEDSDDEDGQGTPSNGRKRTRLNEEGDSVRRNSKGKARALPSDEEEDDENDEEEDQQEEASQPVTRQPLKLEPMWRDPEDGYLAGSIVRVKLQNFQTYEGPAEVFPGPCLNLLLGPNGSGKSTIASAIAVGLNFSLKNIGGIATIDKFVKIGANSGFVEIEIKGKKGNRNTVIKRTININSGSTWHMNGKSTSGKEVSAKVKDFNIQVDNLCAFIPQNRVAEFAAMTPENLLVRTEQAAGDSNLYAWHQKLIEDGAELQRISADAEADETQLKRLEDRNKELEREVERWRQKQELERQVKLWELVVPAKEYRTVRMAWMTAKQELTPLYNRFTSLQDRNGPMHELKRELTEKKQQLADSREAATARSRKKWKDLTDLQKACNDHEVRLEDQAKELEGIADRERKKKGKIQKINEEIESIEEQIANPPKLEDEAAIEDAIAQIRQEKAALAAKWEAVQQRLREHADVTARSKVELESAEKELAEMGDVAAVRFQRLRELDRDCADVVEWLRNPENKRRFKGEIFEPAFISLDIPDSRYRDQIDSLISIGQAKTFVCSTGEDYRLLNKLVNDTPEALGRRGRITTWYRPRDGEPLAPPPMTLETMRGLGFDGYAIDFVTAPDGIMFYLQKEINLHRTAIALDASRIRTQEAIDAVTPSGQAIFITGHMSYRVSRSRYGRQLAQTSSYGIGPARNLRYDALDPQLKEQLESRVNECQKVLAAQRVRDDELSAEHKAAEAEVDACKDRMGAAQKRKTNRAKLLAQYNALRTKLTNAQKKLELESRGPSFDEEKAQIKLELTQIAKQRAQLAARATKIAQEVLQLQARATQAAVQWLQAHANLEALTKLSTTQDSALTRALQAYEAKKTEIDTLRDEGKHKGALYDQAKNNATQEIQQLAQVEIDNHDLSTEDAQAQLESVKAELETIVIHDPGAIKIFTERAKQIEDLKVVVRNKRNKEENYRKSVQRTHAKWFPALSDLVTGIGEKFSNSFAAIGCAGEVRIGNQDGPYDKWRIEIWVKFRSKSPLCMLTAQRQSGGERSLTTIMYLMAMTEYFRVPFSLVDEINQGMDSRAERVVHNQLVNVTCNGDSGQYFLVTPKLLQNLNYHERMRVLVVCNGSGFPARENVVTDLKATVARRLAARA